MVTNDSGMSETGLWVFGIGLVLCVLVLGFATLGVLMFGGRRRFVGSCLTFFGGAVVLAPVVIILAVLGTLL